MPSYIDSDREASFMSEKLRFFFNGKNYLLEDLLRTTIGKLSNEENERNSVEDDQLGFSVVSESFGIGRIKKVR